MRVAGIGCRSACPAEAIMALVGAQGGADLLAAPDWKRDEPGLLEAARRLAVPLRLVSRAALEAAQPRCVTRSAAALRATGLASVAEAAALAGGGKLLRPRLANGWATCAIAGEPGAMLSPAATRSGGLSRMDIRIVNGTTLRAGAFAPADIAVADGRIADPAGAARCEIDASGLLVLPGIVDLHGDAFERQIQPRPGVAFPIPLALAETEAQLLANGITTAFHGVTLSWEPGLRGIETWTALLDALDAGRPRFACDMRVHLRWEAYNLPALPRALDDIAAGRVHLLAFNDHTPAILRRTADAATVAKYSERAGMTPEAFRAIADTIPGHAPHVAEAQTRIAEAARAAGLPMASHDDDTVAGRDAFRGLGARICEFPMAEEVGRAALAAGDWVAMGSPNVVRGGSHLGWASAAAMAEAGICRVLTSDYYYPALPQAPFVLAARGTLSLAEAWALVSTNPAEAAGLSDRGTLAVGQRADIVLVEPGPLPRVVCTVANGRIAALTAEGGQRLVSGG